VNAHVSGITLGIRHVNRAKELYGAGLGGQVEQATSHTGVSPGRGKPSRTQV
jgi:hypothetical protein